MSRIRSIKPEWLDDERLVLASSEARVLSVALLLLADDAGRGAASPVLLGARVFPANPSLFEPALSELRPWFVRLYRARGQTFYEIVNWKKHQKIDRPSPPKTPDPAEGEPLDDASMKARDSLDAASRVFDESSGSPRASRASPPLPSNPIPGPDPSRASPPESEPENPAPAPRRSVADPFAASFARPDDFDRCVFDRWVVVFGKTGAEFDARRAICLAERRLAGMTRQDAEDALAGAAADDYVTGKKDGKRHDRLSFIFGDADRYEEFRDEGRRLRAAPEESGVKTLSPEAAARRDRRLAAQKAEAERVQAELAAEAASKPVTRDLNKLLAGIGGAD